ncbi:MAG: 16S rRNA (guanine(527)-N(7))-methyltransferase RsmG [Sphaerochaetaceae bacterium]|nr:16S rRNA (guanine(527)-N(7))-methyltransferase RsmG [Sphaerochaetaceae bacterium]
MKRDELFELLVEGTDLLGLSLSDAQRRQFERLYDEIELFNDLYHLVSDRGEELIIKHFLDSLAPSYILKQIIREGGERPRCADVGSGGGFPALPLAILFDTVHFDLIERSSRKAGFLLNAVAACNLQDRVKVYHKDLKDVASGYHLVTFRAVSSLADIFSFLDRIVKGDGYICAYKGKSVSVDRELEALGVHKSSETRGSIGQYQYQLHDVKVPFLDAQRTLVTMKKKGEESPL